MRVVIRTSAVEASRLAADRIARLIEAKPTLVLGLTPGGTPRRLYELLAERRRLRSLDASRLVAFGPGEFVGIDEDHPASWNGELRRRVRDPLDIPPARFHLPDARAGDPEAMVLSYERAIELAGGIDLQLVGVGGDGHVAFNDPGSSLRSRTRLVPVVRARRPDLVEAFGGADRVPDRAVTTGLGNLLDADRCLVLAFGEGKAEVVRRVVEGPLAADVPASVVQLHPRATLLVDEAAASGLRDREAHRQAERAAAAADPRGFDWLL